MFVWIKHSRPCDLKVQRSRQNPELLGLCFEVANNDTIDMMCDLRNSLKIEILDL